ncbi:histidine kinase [Micromonospora acroterricola]|uniref:histidine kinase n=1 Tax=Micromonospora acroterricola TaxID=2202421 RepID=A0A317CSC5_9ACTN|nr:histidine kinase [Micromonospora acroterricola]PWR05538.1 histidine kinase [Micromonospora acroterricola]
MTARTRTTLAATLCVAATVAWLVTGRGEFWPRWVYFGVGVVLVGRLVLRRALRVPAGRRRWLALDAAVCALVAGVDLSVWVLSGGGYFWPIWTLLGIATILGSHGWVVSRPPGARERELAERIAALTRSRRGAVDRQAAELQRVERDLHDGAQARLVSLALTLGLAGDLVRRDAEGAARLLEEARGTAIAALDDLRTVTQSIHPAVLADRGLGDAVRALALDLAVPVTVTGDPPPDLPPAVQTAVYFAVAEALANVAKHSGATQAAVAFGQTRDTVRIDVTDNGTGGADPARGTGLRGIIGRLDAIDARLHVSSPAAGPTRVTVTVPREPK